MSNVAVKVCILLYALFLLGRVKQEYTISSITSEIDAKELGEHYSDEDYVNFESTNTEFYFVLSKAKEKEYIPYDEEVMKHVSF